MKPILAQVGAHRGGNRIADHLSPVASQLFGEAMMYDPQPGRSQMLARRYDERGLPATAVQALVDDHWDSFGQDHHLVLSSDDLGSMAGTLQRCSASPAAVQAVGRGPGSRAPVIGVSGVLPRDAVVERVHAQDLFNTLALAAPRQSSQVIRDDGINADALERRRRTVSAWTARSVGLLERDSADLPLGHLQFHWDQAYPLAVMPREDSSIRRMREQAFSVQTSARQYTVAVLSWRRVDFFLVVSARRRMVRLHMAVDVRLPARATDSPRSSGSGALDRPAAFTD